MKLLCALFVCSVANAFTAVSHKAQNRPHTRLRESFGFDFAEDTYKNQPDVLGGEQTYKQWVNKIEENSLLNRKVCQSWAWTA